MSGPNENSPLISAPTDLVATDSTLALLGENPTDFTNLDSTALEQWAESDSSDISQILYESVTGYHVADWFETFLPPIQTKMHTRVMSHYV